jgi:hypothetical protein
MQALVTAYWSSAIHERLRYQSSSDKPLTALFLSTKAMRFQDCVLFLQTVLDGSASLTAHLQLICNFP